MFGLLPGCATSPSEASVDAVKGDANIPPDGGRQDSGMFDAPPKAMIDFAPWTLQVGAASSFVSIEAVTTDREGNVIFTGSISGNLPFATTTDITTYYQRSMVLLGKYNNAGSKIFVIRIDTGYEKSYGIATDSTGAILVVGSTEPPTSTFGDTDGFLHKYDANGIELWKTFYGSTAADVPNAVAIDANDNAFVVGRTLGTLPGQLSGGYGDGFIKKIGSLGTELWTKQFGGQADEDASGVATDVAGNAYVIGSGNTVVVSGPNTSGTNYFTFVRKFDSAGAEVWKKEFGFEALATGKAITVDGAGNVFVVGNALGAFSGFTSAGSNDIFVCKLDPNGNTIWTKQFGTSGSDYGSGIAVDAAGDIFVGGEVNGGLPGQTFVGYSDGFVRKYSSAGIENWTKQFGSSRIDRVSAVTVDLGGNAYAVGTTYGTLPGVTNSLGFNNGFAVKIPR